MAPHYITEHNWVDEGITSILFDAPLKKKKRIEKLVDENIYFAKFGITND